MPKGRGFVRSLNLSLHLLAQASLFLRAWPVRPYCIAPKGTQHYFALLLTPFLLEPVIVHPVRRFISLSATLRREESASPYFNLLDCYIFVKAERLTTNILYYIVAYIHIAKARGITQFFNNTKEIRHLAYF